MSTAVGDSRSSAANVIVAEAARDEHELGFCAYARIGVPSTILVLTCGTPIVWWLAG